MKKNDIDINYSALTEEVLGDKWVEKLLWWQSWRGVWTLRLARLLIGVCVVAAIYQAFIVR